MQIFIDTADIQKIRQYRELGLITGVTTNPGICAADAISDNPVCLIKEVVRIMGDGYVFVQVISPDPERRIEEAEFLAGLGPNIVVKVPMDKAGLQSIPRMVRKGIQVSATAVNSIGRAILAAECGAHYMIPYYGWLEDSMEKPTGLVQDVAEICRAQGYTMRLHIYCRRVADITAAAKAGAWGVLLEPDDLERFFHHAQTAVAFNAHMTAWSQRYGNKCWLDYQSVASV